MQSKNKVMENWKNLQDFCKRTRPSIYTLNPCIEIFIKGVQMSVKQAMIL